MTACLFIGGPADGEWHHVDTRNEGWRVQSIPHLRTEPFGPNDDAIVTFENYFRHQLAEDDFFTYVYIHKSVHKWGILRALLRGYRQPKAAK